MNKIATHNSGTGEKSKSLIDLLLVPFSRCQSKTIIEQYKVGCRLFDIRVNKKGYLSHGLWSSSRMAIDALKELDFMCDNKTYVLLTFEGTLDDFDSKIFDSIKSSLKNIKIVATCCKLPEWTTLTVSNYIVWKKCFSSATWKKWIPIPWLWAKVSGNVDFNDGIFKMVDFL